MDFLTPELFNTLIIVNLIVGLLLAGTRFYRDMTRSSHQSPPMNDDTRPNRTVSDNQHD